MAQETVANGGAQKQYERNLNLRTRLRLSFPIST